MDTVMNTLYNYLIFAKTKQTNKQREGEGEGEGERVWGSSRIVYQIWEIILLLKMNCEYKYIQQAHHLK